MTALLAGWAAAAIAACGGARGPAGPGGSGGPSDDTASLVASADRELAALRALEYRAPRNLEPRWETLRRAQDLLYRACKRGDRPACWRYFEVKRTDDQVRAHEVALALGQGCLAGHELSCRALTTRGPREYGFSYHAGLAATARQCEAGLAAACFGASEHHRDQPAERRAWLQKGCDLGDSRSCASAAALDRDAGEPEAAVAALEGRGVDRARVECGQGQAVSCAWLERFHGGEVRRVEETAEVGCRAGLLEECGLLLDDEVRPELRAYAAEEVCTLQGDWCDVLAALRTDPAGVRDAYEHGCQLGDMGDCQELVKRYRAGALPEPVPGRAADLADYLCKEHKVAEACAPATK